jgi:hypothetical protein
MKLYATLEIPDNLLNDKKKLQEVLRTKLHVVCMLFLQEEMIDNLIEAHKKLKRTEYEQFLENKKDSHTFDWKVEI